MKRVTVVEGTVVELARHVVETGRMVRVKVAQPHIMATPGGTATSARLNVYVSEREAEGLGLRLGRHARVVLEVEP